MSDPPSYVRRYLTDHERRYRASGKHPRRGEAEPTHAGMEALITIAHQQVHETEQDRELADLIRQAIGQRPEIAQSNQPR